MILSRVGVYGTRQVTSRHIRYSEFIAHSLVHLGDSQLHHYCHLQYHNYVFWCSPIHSLDATQLVAAGLHWTLWLHDPHCVTLDHTLSSHTAQPAFYTVVCCLCYVTVGSTATSPQGRGAECWLACYHSSGSTLMLRHRWWGRGCPA
jgi:hypothetical protein